MPLDPVPSRAEAIVSPLLAPQTIDNEGGSVKLTKLESLVDSVNANGGEKVADPPARLVAAQISHASRQWLLSAGLLPGGGWPALFGRTSKSSWDEDAAATRCWGFDEGRRHHQLLLLRPG